jgi:CRISPR-associated protein Cas1
MSERILEIANPARLSIKDAQLVIEREGFPRFVTPVCELNTVLLAHPQVTLTEAVLSRLAEAGAMLVAIDHRYLPAAMMLPIQIHSLQTERLGAQVRLKPVIRKRLWQQIVRAKIHFQATWLNELQGSDGGLKALVARVRSGDPENLEAQAAQRYWKRLFADSKFRSNPGPFAPGLDQNRHLNYGYTLLRASMARAICAAGLHPSLGLHHHNRYDSFCLADDLMEPFRLLIDRRIVFWLMHHSADAPFDSAAKKWLIEAVTMRYETGKEARTLSDILFRTASSLVAVLCEKCNQLDFPEFLTPCQEESIYPPTGVCG